MASSRPQTKIAYSNRALRRHVLLGGMLILALTVVWLVQRRAEPAQSPAVDAEPRALQAPYDAEALVSVDGAEVEPAANPARIGPTSWAQPLALPESASVSDLKKALKTARKHLDEGRLLAPPGQNALEIYRSIQQDDSSNVDAQQGIDAIVQTLSDQARSALNEGREFEVFELMPLLLALAPESEGVTSLRAHLEMLREIEDMLVKAHRAIRAGRELKPKKSSAVKIFRDVLTRDPGNREAMAGLSQIEGKFLAAALAAAERAQFDEASDALSIAATVLKTSPERANALALIDTIRTGKQQALLKQANDAIEMAQGALAQDRIERAEKLGAPRAETRAMRAEVRRILTFSRFKPGDVFRDLINTAGAQGPEMVVLPTGEFQMGSAATEKGRRNNEGPQHRIRFSRGFALAKTELRVADFARFVEATGYITVAESENTSAIYDERGGRMVNAKKISWRLDYAGREAAPDGPVLHVSHGDAVAYTIWLAQVSGQDYRLPSEAEFEYALRAGSAGRFWWGEDSPNSAIENLTGAKDRSRFRRTWSQSFAGYGDGFWGPSPVGRLVANPFGLKDMAGNVSEWVEDCWHESYVRAPADGSAWVNPGCDARVVRGGSWGSAPLDVRSAYRAQAKATVRSARTGFRVARDLVKK